MQAHHIPSSTNEHHHASHPIDASYRLVIHTVLWVIAGLVFVGFAIWWVLT